jgi:UDP-N-acetylmuramoyl-L-alanyl-D-glutamate--2,6-diaminopimelate ligase
MQRLSALCAEVKGLMITGDLTDILISGVAIDSRQIKQGFLFVAIKGSSTDGHDYIGQAIAMGASAVCCERLPDELNDEVVYLVSGHSARDGGMLISAFFGHPSRSLKLVGVTGTNGKTSVCTMLHQTFSRLGYKVGLLSTVENRIGSVVLASTHTTPDSVSLNALLREMVEKGCSHVFMEVSSHAADQERIAGLRFAGAVFTNLTHDHLDYHKTFDQYIKAKKKFFDVLDTDAFALVNIDDKRGHVMLQNSRARAKTYALKQMADFKAKILDVSSLGLHMEMDHRPFYTRLTGAFNAYNLLAVYGVAVLLGEDEDAVLQALSAAEGASGRLEMVASVASRFTVYIDYAHTPDALENVLKSIRGFRRPEQKIIAIYGCGGDRDKAKRPVMGAIGSELADRVIFTADNPRSEDPETILREMMPGVDEDKKGKVLSIADRRSAIQTGMMLAKPGDIILIAGKGHETYQEIKGIRYPFDDKQIVEDIFKGMSFD